MHARETWRKSPGLVSTCRAGERGTWTRDDTEWRWQAGREGEWSGDAISMSPSYLRKEAQVNGTFSDASVLIVSSIYA